MISSIGSGEDYYGRMITIPNDDFTLHNNWTTLRLEKLLDSDRPAFILISIS